MSAQKHNIKITLPDSVFQELEKTALEEGIEVADVLLEIFKKGYEAHSAASDPDKEVIIRDEVARTETEILISY